VRSSYIFSMGNARAYVRSSAAAVAFFNSSCSNYHFCFEHGIGRMKFAEAVFIFLYESVFFAFQSLNETMRRFPDNNCGLMISAKPLN